jgi:hypothetical protein
VNSIMHRERDLIEEVIKAFIANKWCITPQSIASFMWTYGEDIDVEKVEYILQ